MVYSIHYTVYTIHYTVYTLQTNYHKSIKKLRKRNVDIAVLCDSEIMIAIFLRSYYVMVVSHVFCHFLKKVYYTAYNRQHTALLSLVIKCRNVRHALCC